MTDTDLTVCEPAEKVLERYNQNSLPALMSQQHPIHGLFGAAFEAVGGFNRLTEWAGEPKNYGQFLQIFSRMAPPPQSNVSVKQMNITVNPDLQTTVLDGELDE